MTTLVAKIISQQIMSFEMNLKIVLPYESFVTLRTRIVFRFSRIRRVNFMAVSGKSSRAFKMAATFVALALTRVWSQNLLADCSCLWLFISWSRMNFAVMTSDVLEIFVFTQIALTTIYLLVFSANVFSEAFFVII